MDAQGRFFLGLLPHEQLVIPKHKEVIELFRLGSFNGEEIEMVGLKVGYYKPHIHDEATSIIHVIVGTGRALIGCLTGEDYGPGSVFTAYEGMSHGFEVKTDTLLLTRLSAPIYNAKTGKIDFRYA